jgi:hypothetical protein
MPSASLRFVVAMLGCDNDGRMDICLVNGGFCDFRNPNPPLSDAPYLHKRDGTFPYA